MLQTLGPFIPADVNYNHERVLAEYPRSNNDREDLRHGRLIRSRSGRLRKLLHLV